MTNVLSFAINDSDGNAATIITARIDGVLLTDLVTNFERKHGFNDPAGGYGGLIPEFFRYGPLFQYFLGRSNPPTGALSRIFVLGCDCGEVGCWPLTCHIDVNESEVTWQQFEQPHRPHRDYSGFGPFVFNRRLYEEAIRSLPSE